ncbi:phage terminase small subunit [Brenneria uluponensis]|uniref:phage terminase small subunit n=1 Tax=Brenneria uluponensis TaxID=3057057 RepID=UPI0028EA9887|nr:phage terminase small subunit [Brenneria ulupoensis]
MLTPAQRHFQEVMAQRRGHSNASRYTAYEQQLHRLRMDKSTLSQIQSTAAKASAKRVLLPNYQPWIDGVLAADTGQSDEVMTTLMVWAIDAGQIAEALRIAEYVLRHKLPMPDHYSRTAATIVVEEICSPILAAFKADASRAPLAIDLLLRLEQLTVDEDMPDQVRAKLYKALGFTLRLNPTEQVTAREWLQRAITLFSDIGVKRDIELLTRAIKKAAETKPSDEITQGNDATPDSDNTPVNEAATKTPVTAAKTSRKAMVKTARTRKRGA